MTPALRDLRTICAAPYGFWLDTALTGRAPDEASYYGAEPFLVLRSFGETVELWTRGSTDRFTASPFTVLRDLLRQHRGRSGGAAGYLAYDLKRHVERLPETVVDELGLPECHLAFYERIERFAKDEDDVIARMLREWLKSGDYPTLARALFIFGDRVSHSFTSDPELALKKVEFAEYLRDVDERDLPSRTSFFRRLNQRAMASLLLSKADVQL